MTFSEIKNSFAGEKMPFSADTMDFLFENKLHDSREWFAEHRDRYVKYVREPLMQLAEKLGPPLLDIDPLLIIEPKRTLSRVNRDTRFTKDKSLYRDVIWCCFGRDKKESWERPCFFFEASPRGWRYGVGAYWNSPGAMDNLRRLALADAPQFRAMRDALDSQSVFGLEGDRYKRPKCPEAPQELRRFLDLKNIDFIHNSLDEQLLYSPALDETVTRDFKLLAPMYELLLEISTDAG